MSAFKVGDLVKAKNPQEVTFKGHPLYGGKVARIDAVGRGLRDIGGVKTDEEWVGFQDKYIIVVDHVVLVMN